MSFKSIAILPLSQIKPVYRSIVSHNRIERHYVYMKENLRSPFLTVHSDEKGNFTLIEGIVEYETLLAKEPGSLQPCWVVYYSNPLERTYAVLRRIMAYEKTKWVIKYELFEDLRKKHKQTNIEISQRLGVPLEIVDKFDIDDKIPKRYIPSTIKYNSGNMMNKICRSYSIPSRFKPILYERALKPEGDTNRLTEEVYNLLTRLLNNRNGWILNSLTTKEFEVFLCDYLCGHRTIVPDLLLKDFYIRYNSAPIKLLLTR